MFYRLLSVVQRQRTSRGWRNWSSARSGATAAEVHSVTLPAQAQVSSIAYHLSKMGWKDIVLLEQGRLAAGSTRFCAGIISTAQHLSIEQKMADYSNKLYQQLEQETGIQTGVQIYDQTSVVHVMTKKGEVTGVETDKGQIECQYFVNCAGQGVTKNIHTNMDSHERYIKCQVSSMKSVVRQDVEPSDRQ